MVESEAEALIVAKISFHIFDQQHSWRNADQTQYSSMEFEEVAHRSAEYEQAGMEAVL